ncbi:MAG: tRNA pseudouridine(38-40) synthase TruA [candidate division WOR-3 bacterium]|nr:tRNA pseudouridine(38-40) synthase TruA [candidate division WOR-3 bacterium]MCX7756966.1 tRNA pseudouridine(38-40) synthase TruA [candidate division WOR-3 bacterium]MDW7987548.1 tRNA pseudouridine(38-40) synthase TruA [candidate division WOR-3 bacterium]
MNIVLEIEYDGRGFFGWQIQKHKPTVQGAIEEALKKLFLRRIKLYGAGRTDAGVSALGQVANFILEPQSDREKEYLKEPVKLKRALNALLPRTIYIKNIRYAHNDFHARYKASSKIYQYKILTNPSPLREGFAWVVNYPLDFTKIEEGIKLFVNHHNYGPFCGITKTHGAVKIKNIKLKKVRDEIYITIEADRFLYKMARRIVGALVDLGCAKRNLAEVKNALLGLTHRPLSCAPAHGLLLVKVKYPQRYFLK